MRKYNIDFISQFKTNNAQLCALTESSHCELFDDNMNTHGYSYLERTTDILLYTGFGEILTTTRDDRNARNRIIGITTTGILFVCQLENNNWCILTMYPANNIGWVSKKLGAAYAKLNSTEKGEIIRSINQNRAWAHKYF